MSAVVSSVIEFASIDVYCTGAIGIIVLNRPERLNALSGRMPHDLLAAVDDLDADSVVRVILLRGTGRAFCVGVDVAMLSELRGRNATAEYQQLVDVGSAVERKLQGCKKVTVAAVHGPAAGAGANLALACDLRLGSSGCSFTQNFARFGLGPDWAASYLLPRVVGADRARELLLTGRSVRAEEAIQLGLIHRLLPQEAFDAALWPTCEQLATLSPHSVGAIKGALRLGSDIEPVLAYERDADLHCFSSPEAYAALAAFRRALPDTSQ